MNRTPTHGASIQYPSIVEWGILIGSFSLFFFLFLLFAKFLPTIAMTDVKETIPVPART